MEIIIYLVADHAWTMEIVQEKRQYIRKIIFFICIVYEWDLSDLKNILKYQMVIQEKNIPHSFSLAQVC